MAKDVLTVMQALSMAAPFPLAAIREAATKLMDAYIWVFPVGKGKAQHKECWCEGCGTRFSLETDRVEQREKEMLYPHWGQPTEKPLPKTIHRQWYKCPKCEQRLELHETFRPRAAMYQEIFLTWYWADPKNPDALYGLGCVCSRDYRAHDRYDRLIVNREPWDIRTQVRPYTLTVFRWGQGGARFERRGRTLFDWVNNKPYIDRSEASWAALRECRETTYASSMAPYSKTEFWMDMDSVKAAIKSSGFGRRVPALADMLSGTVRGRGVKDLSEPLNRVARYPSIEYLVKMGFAPLVEDLMEGRADGRTINWRGKTAEKVLGLDMQRIRAIRKAGIRVDSVYMGLTYKLRDAQPVPAPEDVARVADLFRGSVMAIDDIHKVLSCVPESQRWKAIKYIEAQTRRKMKGDKKADEVTIRTIPRDIKDYYNECLKLGISLEDPYYLLPSNFERMHAETSARIKVEADKRLDKKIADWCAKLEPDYRYSALGLTLRPLANAAEVIYEGSALHHCVGQYVDNYAKKGTILCALRRDGDAETPFHTVEFSARDSGLVQCRGDHNKTKPEDKPLIDAFWQAFEAWRREKARKSA